MRRFAPRGLVISLAVIAAPACFTSVPVPPPAEYHALERADVPEIMRELATIRGLQAKRGVTVELLSRAELVREIGAREAAYEESDAKYEPFLAAFDLIPPPDKRAAATSEREFAEKFVNAFYDRKQHRIFVPNAVPTTEYQRHRLEGTLAHELYHAIQHEHFERPKLPTSDAALAWRSLVEGDATVVAAGYLANRQGIPIERSIFHVRYQIELPPAVNPALSPEQRSALSNAPHRSKVTNDLPYLHGAAFVADLYRAGGFALVNLSYTRPPATTEHILHPQKYLDGELPRVFADLPPPSGWERVLSDSLGEVGVRVLLEPCLGAAAAERVGEGWNGDRSFVLARGTELAMGWASAWDTERDAEETEDALSRLSGCLVSNGAGDRTISPAYSVRRDGTVVAFSRGGEPALRAEMNAALLSLPGPAVVASPLTSARIPPVRPPPRRQASVVGSDSFRNDWLGLAGAIPQTWSSKVDPKGPGLRIREPRNYGNGRLWLSGRVARGDATAAMLDEVEGDIATELWNSGHEIARLEDDEEIETRIGTGSQRTWLNRTTSVRYRLVVVPICNGAGAIAIEYNWGSTNAINVFEAWVGSLRWLSPGTPPPVCEYLSPR